jgi:aminoglycoside 2''-phosphotransferase
MYGDAITKQFPHLAPVSVSHLGEGCDSIAVLVNDEWVFRFPKTVDVERQLAMEARLLPLLADRLPLPVPRFHYHGLPDEHFPRHFVGYPKITGRPALGVEPGVVGSDEIARVGQFLAALHSIDLGVARQCGVPLDNLHESLDEVRIDALEGLEHAANADPRAPLGRWRTFIATVPPVVSIETLVLAHNDLAAEHILIDPEDGRLTGVIDWSDAAITGPEVDFAGLFHWGGEPLVRAVLRTYESVRGPLPSGALQFARYLGACRGAMDVTFGLEMQRPDYVAAGLRALRLCAGGEG